MPLLHKIQSITHVANESRHCVRESTLHKAHARYEHYASEVFSVQLYKNNATFAYFEYRQLGLAAACTSGGVIGFFPGGTGGPPSSKNFVNPPIRHLSPFLDQGLSPQLRFVPENLKKYIFLSSLTTFKLKSTLKSCISCLK